MSGRFAPLPLIILDSIIRLFDDFEAKYRNRRHKHTRKGGENVTVHVNKNISLNPRVEPVGRNGRAFDAGLRDPRFEPRLGQLVFLNNK